MLWLRAVDGGFVGILPLDRNIALDHTLIAALGGTLAPHLVLGKSRLETLCLLIVGMVSARTVNLTHLAAERSGRVLLASTYRRLQRFFQYVTLPQDGVARLVIALTGAHLGGLEAQKSGTWYLCLDRTNWKIGVRHVNLLVLAVSTKRFRVPLMWTVLDRAGHSNTAERVALMQRYLALFGPDTIRALLADREFIGLEWLNFLAAKNIPFAIRVRAGQLVVTPQGKVLTLATLLARCRGPRRFAASFPAAQGNPACPLHFAARRIKGGELLIVASTQADTNILSLYRKRWAIECMFGDAKTRGFNIEDTRLSIAARLHTLIAVLALAMAWVCRTATATMGRQTPPRKTHGYYAKSWFRTSFDELRRRLRTDPKAATEPLANINKIGRVV